MDMQELGKILSVTLTTVATGHPDYKRVFINCKGVQIGRVTILCGQYDHVKWYSGLGSGPLNDFDKVVLSWTMWEKGLAIPIDSEWESIKEDAASKKAADLKAKQDWRRSHPKKGRKGLSDKNIRCFVEHYPYSVR